MKRARFRRIFFYLPVPLPSLPFHGREAGTLEDTCMLFLTSLEMKLEGSAGAREFFEIYFER